MQDVLFEQGSFNVQSRHHNLIAFSLDVGLLLKVLRSASGADTERLEVKLAQKPVRVPGAEEPEMKPFMTFTARVRAQEGAGRGVDTGAPACGPRAPCRVGRPAPLCAFA